MRVFEAYCREKLGPLALRLALGLFCVYHGFLKIRATGGTSWNPQLGTGWQLAIAWIEFTAGVAILLGFRCRIAALFVLIATAGLFFWSQGWRIWSLPIQSLELTVLLTLMGASLLFIGAGDFSLDARAGGKAPRKK